MAILKAERDVHQSVEDCHPEQLLKIVIPSNARDLGLCPALALLRLQARS